MTNLFVAYTLAFVIIFLAYPLVRDARGEQLLLAGPVRLGAVRAQGARESLGEHPRHS